MANKTEQNYKQVISQFLNMQPTYFHIGGQRGDKTHLSFLDSDIDLPGILSLYPENARVTLEVSNDWAKTAEDLKIFKRAQMARFK